MVYKWSILYILLRIFIHDTVAWLGLIRRSFTTINDVAGDLFDEGKWCPPEEFDYYVRRFHSLFSVDPDYTTIHVMAGNHDIGFHYAVTPYLDSRFKEAFQTESVQLKLLDDKIPIVLINSVAFEGDSCFLCKSTSNRLDKVVETLKVCGGKYRLILSVMVMVVIFTAVEQFSNTDVPLPALPPVRRSLR